VKEYLATLDDTAWGGASDVVPKFVSPSDPAAQWTGAHKGPATDFRLSGTVPLTDRPNARFISREVARHSLKNY
jgi:hypothetical protein